MSAIEAFVMARESSSAGRTPDLQTTLAGMMGHDLRQSLQIVRSAYALLRARLDSPPQTDWLEQGEQALDRVTRQLNSLVDAYCLSERAAPLEMTPVALAALFWRVRNENEGAAIERAVELRTYATDATVISNPLLLEGILRNLVTNAIKYTRPGGRVLLGCRRRGAEMRIDVYDTGIGIAREALPGIFDAFSRLTPEHAEGLGIGLSIVRRVLELLGHRIEVRSVPGKGSLFSIYLPSAAGLR